MYQYFLFLSAVVGTQANMYLPDIEYERSPYRSDYLNELKMLRSILRDEKLHESEEPYLDFHEPDPHLFVNEFSPEIPYDFDGIDDFEPRANIRDQEYLKHSSLWSRYPLNSYRISYGHNSIKPVKEEKQENQLPAYCTPPNPCPVGYTKENDCIEEFENTAAFSRDFQAAQDCMCDSEHMVDCPKPEDDDIKDNLIQDPQLQMTREDFDKIVQQYNEENPYFIGEKLPIAAKKGFNVGY